PQIMPFPGSNLEAALQLADTMTAVSSAPGTVILFSDEFTEESFDLLQTYCLQGKNKIEIFPMNIEGESEVRRKLNSVDGLTVHQLTLDKSDVESLATTIAENLDFREEEEKKEDDWLDRGLWLAIPFALFILFGFRRGRVIFSVLLMATLYSCDGNTTFVDLWLTKDFQAQKAYNKGDFEEAAGLFSEPLRKGVSFYKAGDYDAAIQYFSQDTTEMGAYNLGLAYYQSGNFAAAESAFGKALEMNPELANARTNQQLAEELIPGTSEADPDQAEEAAAEETAQNIKNSDPEDLGGGGQEATKEDMEKERKEESVATDIRKGKELDEVPDNFESGRQDEAQKVLMRKVDDDPALFLKRKFIYQAKTKNMIPKNDD
ncbi:MAG: tetratricopeptide repeat protein, partial [Bacteroides sp.]|nr:tetratricopeptide repeat protein [Bacteroides sp.]